MISRINRKLRNTWATTIIFVALVLFGILNPVFLSVGNLANVLLQASIIGIISLGMNLVIIVSGIDLSVGAVAALAGIILARLITAGLPDFLAFPLAICFGGASGLTIGSCVVKFRLPPFIASLGLMGIARGGALALSNGEPLSATGSVAQFFGSGNFLNIPCPIIFFIIIAVITHLFLNFTKWGVRLYAIGGNIKAAWIVGIPVGRYVTITYVTSGLLAAFAGLILAGRLGSALPLSGNLYELDAITATVLGGATLAGGRGSALGTVAGAILLAAVRNAMVIANLSPYYQPVVTGIILLCVLLLNKNQSRVTSAFGSDSDQM